MNNNEEKLEKEIEQLKQKKLTQYDLHKIIEDDPKKNDFYNKKSIWAFEELKKLKKSEKRMAVKALIPWMIAASIPLFALGFMAYELQLDGIKMLFIGMIFSYYIWSLDYLFYAQENNNIGDFLAPSYQDFCEWFLNWWLAPARVIIRAIPAILIAGIGFHTAMLIN